jgi:Leucine-rich repeat (LRR) protein
LMKLSFQGCENLKQVPQTIGSISSLSILNLFHCKSIESLPTTIVDLKHLTELWLGGCENLKEVLQTIWRHLLIINIGLISLQVH